MGRSLGSDPAAIAVQFNDAITRHDIDRLTALMTADHTFTDTPRDAATDASNECVHCA